MGYHRKLANPQMNPRRKRRKLLAKLRQKLKNLRLRTSTPVATGQAASDNEAETLDPKRHNTFIIC